ncbi:tail protein X [bacterium]|nr:tail protein X [bacterium]
MSEYITRDGDRVDLLVLKFYGDTKWQQLFLDANPGIAIYDFLPAGLTLYFPEKPTEIIDEKRLWN